MTTYAIDPDRLIQLQEATIHTGHSEFLSRACTVDWASYLAGDEILTDTPRCVDLRIARLVADINDGITDEEVRTAKGRSLAPLLVGTAGHGEEIAALLDRLAVRRLRNIVLPLAVHWPNSIREEVVRAIEGVCDALGDGSAGSVAASAGSAVESAARSIEAGLLIAELERFHDRGSADTEGSTDENPIR